jgi:hypothetical protein
VTMNDVIDVAFDLVSYRTAIALSCGHGTCPVALDLGE